MMDNGTKKSRILAAFVAFFPLISLGVAVVLMMGGVADHAENSAPAAEPSDTSPSIFVILAVLLVIILLGTKLYAIVSNIRLKYFGWIFHVLEIYFVFFLLGLLVVFSTFNQSWDALGAAKLVFIFLLAVANLKLKDIWLGNTIRSSFHVARITHADL